jgi:hypothetical protein
MSFRAVLSLFPAASAALKDSVISPFSGILIIVLLVPRVPVDTFIIAGVEYIPLLFITNRDTFFIRRKILLIILPEL